MEKIELNFGRTLSDRNSIYYECVSDNDLSGDYYRASDYEALQAENERLRKALDDLVCIGEILLKEKAINGPMSFHGAIIKSKAALRREVDDGRTL